MVQKELPQAWWFDSHNLARTSPWLSNTLSELDDKTKQMLKMIDQDADSFAQRAEMYYKKRPVLVDMLGELYGTHRSLAEQYDLLKHGNGTRHTVFGPSSCTQSWSHQTAAAMGGNGTTGSRSSSSLCSDTYDSESEVDDPEQEDIEEELSEPETMMKPSQNQADQAAQLELMRAEIEMLKEKNAELQRASAEVEMLKEKNAVLQRVREENTALKAELAAKDEEKREVIRQLASSFDIVKKENSTLRECIIKNSKNSSSSPPSSSRGFDFKKLTKDLFSAKLFTAHCKATGPMVAL